MNPLLILEMIAKGIEIGAPAIKQIRDSFANTDQPTAEEIIQKMAALHAPWIPPGQFTTEDDDDEADG